jgi:hypothetical protein
MITKIRTNIFLTRIQQKKLRALAKKRGAPVAALVRRAIDEYFARNERKSWVESDEKQEKTWFRLMRRNSKMDVSTTISERASIRAYKATDVEEDKLRKVLEAARLSQIKPRRKKSERVWIK